MKYLSSIIITAAVAVALFLIYIYSGFYNISARVPHNGLTKWIISATTDNSVKHHSKDLLVPTLTDSSLVNAGYEQYTKSCIGCHGAPGRERGKTALAMYPKPPLLAKAAAGWGPAELFWITKNGIKMTGMPSFAGLKSDQEIWSIIAFIIKMENMTPAQFSAMNSSSAAGEKLRYKH